MRLSVQVWRVHTADYCLHNVLNKIWFPHDNYGGGEWKCGAFFYVHMYRLPCRLSAPRCLSPMSDRLPRVTVFTFVVDNLHD